MAGGTLDQVDQFGKELETFWKNFKVADPGFRFTQETPQAEWCRCIPIALHGDEGRGKAKQPVMVISVQTVLPLTEGKSNMKGPLRSL